MTLLSLEGAKEVKVCSLLYNVTLLFTFVNVLNDFSLPNTFVVGAANHLCYGRNLDSIYQITELQD